MPNSRHGLGNDSHRPAALITPCPAVIDQFFEKQLHYGKLTKKANDKEPYTVIYQKGLSHPDNPRFESLANNCYLSRIVIDAYNGNIIDSYFEVRAAVGGSVVFRTFQELADIFGEDKAVEWLFKWHLNIVHMTREYLKGGWLYRRQRQANLAATRDKYVILNKKGFTNILENAKPDNVEFLGNGKVK